MKKIIDAILIFALTFIVSEAYGQKFKILNITEGKVKIGPYGKQKEYGKNDTFSLGKQDHIIFASTRQGLQIGRLDSPKAEVYNVVAKSYPVGTPLYRYIIKKQGISMADPQVSRDTSYFVGGRLPFASCSKGDYVRTAGNGNNIPLEYDDVFGYHIKQSAISGKLPVNVNMYSKDGKLVGCYTLDTVE